MKSIRTRHRIRETHHVPCRVGLVVAATVLAQDGPTGSFFEANEEAIVHTYRADMERQGRTSSLPVAVSFAAFVEYEKATSAEDHRRRDELERRGEVFPVESGTRCRVIRGGGMSVGPIVRTAQEIRLLNGRHKGQSGWIVAKHLRKRSRIRVEPPERFTDENWDTPRPLALALQAQDKVVYRELLAARDKAMAAARALPRGERQRQAATWSSAASDRSYWIAMISTRRPPCGSSNGADRATGRPRILMARFRKEEPESGLACPGVRCF
jgi:hypothetical protein